IEDHAAEGVVNAVVEVIAEFAAAHGLADDLGHGGAGGGDKEAPRFGEYLYGCRKQAVQLGVDRPGQALEGGDRVVVMSREAATDVEELKVEAARLRLRKYTCRKMQGLHVVLRIGALAADMEAKPLDHKLVVVGIGDQVHCFAGESAELARQL